MMASGEGRQDLNDAFDSVAGQASPVPVLAAAVRRLERRGGQAPTLVEPCVRALDAALVALDEARGALEDALRATEFDPRELERIEERLFALRAAARKFNVAADELATLAQRFAADVAAIDAGEGQLATLERTLATADAAYLQRALALSRERNKAAKALDRAVGAELPPMKLERARFVTEITTDDTGRDPAGIDRVEFWAQTNPGTRPGPLMKVASGGELSRFMLALKVVLADKGSAPTLVFDEIDNRGRRRRGRCDRAAAVAPGRSRAGGGGDARSPGRGPCGEPLSHRQGAGAQIHARRHPRRAARRRTPAGGDRADAGRRHHHRRGARGRCASAGGCRLMAT
jgi:DNA repair protein RecN (Recombination protein N)